MSSTNRGYDRHKSDYYITPQKEIVKFCMAFHEVEPDWDWGKTFLDPCAGGDENHDMSYPAVWHNMGVTNQRISTIDIRKDSRADIKADYLQTDIERKDIIMTNPPFKIALGKNYNRFTNKEKGIIEKALEDTKENGFIIMLLRLNFFGTGDRKPFWDKYMPKYTFVHHKRMSFTDDGNTDSIEYAHFVWQKGNYPKYSKLKVI